MTRPLPPVLTGEIVPAGRGPISRADAEALTVAIRTSASRLWMLVAQAYERKAWKALGYDSWRAYVRAELAISESRAWQLVDTGRVMLAIAEETHADPASIDPVPARTVAKVKDQLPALRKAIRAAMRAGTTEADEVSELVFTALAEVLGEPAPRAKTRAATKVACPVCDGTGSLGTGRRAAELAERAARWLARRTG